MIRPVRSLSDLSTYQEICHRVKELTETGWSAVAIAEALNKAGYRPPRAHSDFRAPLVAQLQREIGITAPRPRVRKRDGLLPDEWWPAELVHKLGIPKSSLHHTNNV